MLLLSQMFYPDYQSTSQLFSDLAFSLGRRGCQMTVITAYPLDLGASRTSCSKLPARETRDRVDIRRVGFRLNYERNLLLRAFGYASHLSAVAWRQNVLGRTI
jgi:hypothetical protein